MSTIEEMAKKFHRPKSSFVSRADGRIEWVCSHNVGHTIWAPRAMGDSGLIHGCDGCCSILHELAGEYKYLMIYDVSNKKRYKNKKTKTFQVRSKSNDDLLGMIEWDSRWRQYVFTTLTVYQCKFSKDCLEDVSAFIGVLMEERKK